MDAWPPVHAPESDRSAQVTPSSYAEPLLTLALHPCAPPRATTPKPLLELGASFPWAKPPASASSATSTPSPKRRAQPSESLVAPATQVLRGRWPMTPRVQVLWRMAEQACDEFETLLTEERIRSAHLAVRYAATESWRQNIPFKRYATILEGRITAAWIRLFQKRKRIQEAYQRATYRPPVSAPRFRKMAKHKVVREERVAAGLCTSCGRARDLAGVTCSKCLATDKEWRKKRAIREKTAQYLDDDCQPMVVTGNPRMLPVIGERRDCAREDECLTELIKACGTQDPPGSSCPKDCRWFERANSRNELLHAASSRYEAV